METEHRGGGRRNSHGSRLKQSIDQAGLPIPGSYSVGSSSLLGEPHKVEVQRSHCPISNTPCEPSHVSIPRRFSQPDD